MCIQSKNLINENKIIIKNGNKTLQILLSLSFVCISSLQKKGGNLLTYPSFLLFQGTLRRLQYTLHIPRGSTG